MEEQPLAARLDATPLYEGCGDESDLPERAAAELRRQHAEIERLSAALASVTREAHENKQRARSAEAHAARYRWIRQHPKWIGWEHDFRPDEVDCAVDNAIRVTPNYHGVTQTAAQRNKK